MYSYQIFFPKSMLKFFNMNIPLKRVQDCLNFVEKIQISQKGKTMINRRLEKNLSSDIRLSAIKILMAICFIAVR